MQAQDLISLEERYGAHNYHPLDVVVERAEGVWMWDVSGKKYLDCLAAYSSVNQGHRHPKIIQALVDQAQKVTITSRAFRNDQLGSLYRELCELSDFDMMLPMNTGAEAVETALKLARKFAYATKHIPQNQAEIIVASDNFHGRTITVISFSSDPHYKDMFGPHTPGFKIVQYGDAKAIADAITPNTAAVMLEPIQGEAGVIVPPQNYLREVSRICKANNVLFIADEIQSGLGRTGAMFACDHEGVKPDVMILGKALGGGVYPVSAVLAQKEIMSLFTPGEHGSTFGGNPLGAAVARASLKVIVEEQLPQRAAALGEYFQERLAEINSPLIKEMRGKGLMIGVELHPSAGGARKYCEALRDRGVLCKETHQHVIRFAPPLIIEKEQIDWAVEQITSVLQA